MSTETAAPTAAAGAVPDEWIRRIPKVDLHCHLIGTVRASTFAELARREHVPAAAPPAESGWEQLYREHVEQADRGAGLDFLAGVRGSAVARESH